MKNKISKLLVVGLVAYFGGTKLQALVAEQNDITQSGEAIPGAGVHFANGENAFLGEELGPVIVDSNQGSQHLLGTDTASRPPVQHLLGTDTASRPPVKLGTNPDTYTPRWLDTPADLGEDSSGSFNEIKKDESFADGEMLNYLAQLFKEDSSVIQEPSFEDSVSTYLEEFGEQAQNLDKDLETLLPAKTYEELSEKYPLIINNKKILQQNNVEDHYPDIMKNYPHPGFGPSEVQNHDEYSGVTRGYPLQEAPDLGEIKPIKDSMSLNQ